MTGAELAGIAAIFTGVAEAVVSHFWPSDAETWLRLVAAAALVWHPWHEQRLGFRHYFNEAIQWNAWERDQDYCIDWRGPLSRRQNAVQAAALVTVFPALALFGPWWALVGIATFYAGDYLWTHWTQKIPGLWSAVLALLATCAALWTARPDFSEWDYPLLVTSLAAEAGLLVLALPWWMAYRKVKTA